MLFNHKMKLLKKVRRGILIDLKLIKPKEKGVSDKYSWNLYNFLLRKSKQEDLDNLKIYYNPVCWVTGRTINYDIKNVNTTHIHISLHQLSAYSLSSILMKGSSNEYYIGDLKDDWIDVTDEYISTYLSIGRCLFDSSHTGWMQYSQDRVRVTDNQKICNWCNIKLDD